jgi:hypothetical protein
MLVVLGCVGLGLVGWTTAEAASARKTCVRSGCKAQRQGCLGSFNDQFKFLKSQCADKQCKTGVKRLLKQSRKRCKTAFRTCKRCCTTEDPARCGIEVLGDGLCGGLPAFEQCDGADAPACPGRCQADCTCLGGAGIPGIPGSPGTPAPAGAAAVGSLEAGKARIVLLDGTNTLPTPRLSFDAFIIAGSFFSVTSTPNGTSPVEQIGNCQVIADISSLPPAPAPAIVRLDPGSPGAASSEAATVEVFVSNGVIGTAEDPAELLGLGFDAGQQISFTFPGGSDIGPFAAALEVPSDVGLVSPNLDDPALRLNYTEALDLSWAAPASASAGSTTVNVTVAAATVDEDPPNETLRGGVVSCDLPDTGSGTIPASIMSRLPADANVVFLTVIRARTESIGVPLSAGGTGALTLTGLVTEVWTRIDVVGGPPDIPTEIPKR